MRLAVLVPLLLIATVGNRNKPTADIGCSLLQFGYYGQHQRNWSLCTSLSITINSVKLERPKLAAEQRFCYVG